MQVNKIPISQLNPAALIACEQLNRACYMMELDPVYCDVIIKRWENLTGQKAVKLSACKNG